jgi:hypothetical protein
MTIEQELNIDIRKAYYKVTKYIKITKAHETLADRTQERNLKGK